MVSDTLFPELKGKNILMMREDEMQKVKSLGLKEGRKIVDAIIEAAEKSEGRPMAAAVVDRHGHLVYFARMDGASPVTVRMSIFKSQTALDVMRDTIEHRAFLDKINTNYFEFCSPTYTVIPGGVLIKTKDGTIVGACGTSGRAPLVSMGDEELARIGVKAFESSEAFNL